MKKEIHPVWNIALMFCVLSIAIYFKWEAKLKVTGDKALITHDWLVNHP